MNETDLMTAILGDGSNICLSGGAEGADLQWGMCAGLAGHKVIHWSFEGHRTNAPAVEVVQLSKEQLAKADPAMKVAAKHLKKGVPYRPWVKPLIQRNWYQVAWSQSVFAVCDMIDYKPQGGTAWAIQMFLDRPDLVGKDKPVYVFAQNHGHWMGWSPAFENFMTLAGPPNAPTGIWAGIGSRELTPSGKQAIRDLLGYIKPII